MALKDLPEVESCEFIHVHEDIVKKVKQEMPGDETLYDLAELFRIFADSTRIKILYCLMDAERCVADIAEVTGSTQSAVSHQLRILKQARLVRFRREGRNIVYSLADDHVNTMLSQGMTHICE